MVPKLPFDVFTYPICGAQVLMRLITCSLDAILISILSPNYLWPQHLLSTIYLHASESHFYAFRFLQYLDPWLYPVFSISLDLLPTPLVPCKQSIINILVVIVFTDSFSFHARHPVFQVANINFTVMLIIPLSPITPIFDTTTIG